MSLRLLWDNIRGCVKCLYIEKERIPAVWTVFLIFVITTVAKLNTGRVESMSDVGGEHVQVRPELLHLSQIV